MLAVAVLTSLAVAFAALVEIGAAVCGSAKMFTAYGLFWTFVLAPFLFRHPTRIKFRVYAGLIVCLIILYVVPWNSRKPFLRDLDKIQIGMTVDQVEIIMGRYMKGTGWPAIPGSKSPTGQLVEVGAGGTLATSNSPSGELVIQDSITYRHSNDGAFNSDWGVVKFNDGKVVAKKFMPD